ncbi:MAG: hypothetical protein LAQ69_45465, partial [Acidobacteriia bacterium]|nr:hypothetical protein [Terriglobia bacterium]
MDQITDDFRNAAIGKMHRLLSQGVVVMAELDDLKQEFEIRHGHYPDLFAAVNFLAEPDITGRGSLEFRELANRAARGDGAAGDEAWKDWLDILVGYLLENDHDREYIQTFPGTAFIPPAGTTDETHLGEKMHGETYQIHGVFKASALCCERRSESAPSWPVWRCATHVFEQAQAHVGAGARERGEVRSGQGILFRTSGYPPRRRQDREPWMTTRAWYP